MKGKFEHMGSVCFPFLSCWVWFLRVVSRFLYLVQGTKERLRVYLGTIYKLEVNIEYRAFAFNPAPNSVVRSTRARIE